MPILGAHMSIAGGFYKAAERAAAIGCDCVQVFTSAPGRWPIVKQSTALQDGVSSTKNNNQWRAKTITDAEAERFATTVKDLGLAGTLSHASYLINIGSPDDELWNKSVEALIVEVQRATQLSIPFVVFHPGSFTTSSEAQGLSRIIEGIDQVHLKTDSQGAMLLLENTAGQGSNLGWDFDQLANILSGVQVPDRLGVCIDTCHAFAAGYPLADPVDYKATMKKLDKAVGLSQIKAFHLNDSKGAFGSRKDRHEHIGRGEMGLEPFRNLLNDRRFQKIPMYLETPKGTEDDQDLDAVNLETLRSLIAST